MKHERFSVVRKHKSKKIFLSLSLQKKLILAFLSILIAVMAVTTYYNISSSTTRIKSDLRDKLTSNSIAADIMLDSKIKMFDSLCLSIANNNSLKMPILFDMKSQIKEQCEAILSNNNDSIDILILAKPSGEITFSSDESFVEKLSPYIQDGTDFSGLVELGNLYLISSNTIKDTSDNVIGHVIIVHDIQKDTEFLKNISNSVNTFTILYNGDNFVSMSDKQLNIYLPKETGYGSLNSSKVYNSPNGIYAAESTRKMFDKNLFIYYKTLADIKGNPVGILAVGETDDLVYSNIRKTLINMAVILLASIIAAFVMIYFFASRITNPIKGLIMLMKNVEGGDLTVESKISRNDEIGYLATSFNNMVKELNVMVTTIKSKSEDIAESSGVLSKVYTEITNGVGNITESIREVATGAESNSATVEEITAGLEDVAGEASSIAEECTRSSEISSNAVKNVNTGMSSVNNVVDAVDIVSKKTQYALNRITELEEYSNKIEDIVKAIVQVADGINLLGLNATIEAARAGAAGAGFAVVADEINKLAIQTKTKVQEITALNVEIIKRVRESVTGIKNSAEDVDTSVRLLMDMEKIFSSLSDSIDSVDKNVKKITEAAMSQASATEEITSAMDSIASITVNSASASTNIYESVKKVSSNMDRTKEQILLLEQTSRGLKELVEKFKVVL